MMFVFWPLGHLLASLTPCPFCVYSLLTGHSLEQDLETVIQYGEDVTGQSVGGKGGAAAMHSYSKAADP